jgi:hypothetical protein
MKTQSPIQQVDVVKQPDREADSPSEFIAEVKNEWSFSL